MLSKDYTLIIPTYNRPKEFEAFIRYLEEYKVGFDILVLDSSSPEEAKRNKSFISQVKLNIELVSFPSTISPFEKFWMGVQKVKTPFCSLCADDDVLVVSSIKEVVEFLKNNSSYVAAHGLYFTFLKQKEVSIPDLIYRRDVLNDDDSIIRLRALFECYEAITYAVYRTPVLRDILSQLQSVKSMLGRELLGGALTVAKGKVKRLSVLYSGRSAAESHAYINWHPVEMLITSPDILYQEYGRYRKILVDTLKMFYNDYSEEELYKIVDIIHFSYMSEYLSPNILLYLGDQIMKHRSVPDIMNGFWPILIQNQPVSSSALRKKSQNLFSNFIKKYRKQNSLRIFPQEFEGLPFHFLENFKTKIDIYNEGVIKELLYSLTRGMKNYMSAYNKINL